MKKLSHISEDNRPSMVDVTAKPLSQRLARARGSIELQPETIELIRENRTKKGNVLITAELAGVQAAKRTAELIPLCHPLQLTDVQVSAELTADGVTVTADAKCTGQTGVEMEALTAVGVALLTVYDMCKAVDKAMTIGEVELIEKTKKEVES